MGTQNDKRKITVQMWRPLLERLNDFAADACIGRDAYLDVVFANEVKNLKHELQDKRNSDCARAFIKQCFAEIKDHKQASFTLSANTAQAITDTCDQINVLRDAFVNRVIYFLVIEPSDIAQQFGVNLGRYETAIFDKGRGIKWLLLESPIQGIKNLIQNDPFMAIRLALNIGYSNPGPVASPFLHEQILGTPTAETREKRGLVGFNVYLEDEHVPGTSANKNPMEFFELDFPVFRSKADNLNTGDS